MTAEGNTPERAADEALADPKTEGKALTRRELLQRSGPYSIAVLGLVTGSSAWMGCGEPVCGSGDYCLCEDSCQYPADGECDDGGPGSEYAVCQHGSDCYDCDIRPGPYADVYSDSYADYSDSYADYSDSYADYSDYYNYYNTVYYYNYYINFG